MQSKLISLVLGASLVSLLLTGLLSFAVARHLLAEGGYERLTAIRNARAVAIKDALEQLADHVMTLSETRMTIDAAKRFSQGFNQLQGLNDSQQKELRNYYETIFIPKLKTKVEGDPAAATYYPENPNERSLKYFYLAEGPAAKATTKPTKEAVSTATAPKEGSGWSQTHKEYDHRFARLAKLFDYADIMIADIKTGTIVYSVGKQDDLGTNLLSGPYSDSQAAKVFREVKQSRDPFFITFSDFEQYKPSYGQTTMFVGTTIFDGDQLVGALIFQVDNDRMDRLMTANRQWQEVGMGESGETYLVGEDSTFRSSPRAFLENPKEYLKLAERHGVSEEKINLIRKTGTPVLVQQVKTEAARSALAGKTGTASYNDYRGVPVVASYQPLRFGPFDWGLVAKIDQAEVFSGIRRLARNLLLLAAILIPVLTFLTLWLSRQFVRPIRRLLDATEKISGGDYSIHIPVAADDEFGDLATAFNTMSDTLAEREHALKEQAEENDRLLRSILPGSAAARLKQGAAGIAETHPSVSVIYAEIEGWNDITQTLTVEESIRQLSELTSALDDCAARFDVDKLQDVGSTYLAVSGLSRPRIDHEKRAVDCALAMLELMHRFNATYNVHLSLDIGVHAGPLPTGVVSGERLAFDIWGKTLNLARGVHDSPKRNVIQVTAPIVEALEGLYRFQPLPAMSVKGHGEIPILEVEGPIQPSGVDGGEASGTLQEVASR
ncbi:MAG: adenylate/guanylate cyclase domain-containing protein [Cyanobium sp.]